MNATGPSLWTEEKLEALRQKLQEKQAGLIEQMMLETKQGGDPYKLDFTGREALAARLGQEFAALLLEQNLLEDRSGQIVQDAATWQCPRCGEEALPLKDPDGNELYEDLTVKSKVGALHLKLRQFGCGKCRKIFSPLPPELEARARELQPSPAEKSGIRRRQ